MTKADLKAWMQEQRKEALAHGRIKFHVMIASTYRSLVGILDLCEDVAQFEEALIEIQGHAAACLREDFSVSGFTSNLVYQDVSKYLNR